MKKLITLFIFLIVSNQTFGKSKCQDEWNDLKSAQALSRQSSSEATRNWEKHVFKIYNACIKNKNKEPVSKSVEKQVNKKTTSNKTKKLLKPKKYYKRELSNQPIEMKARYYDGRQNDWLKYYRAHKSPQCKKPKSTKLFAKCIEERDKLSIEFERHWRMENPGKQAPPAIKLDRG
ncbi:hypothetical protein J7384_10735 [Endozoicomonas sp. G2_1]|uniref:hypothetical protein n=1 Tax=Endozoicomonas sp. G2_1 TaxID=2821091 RepID=UPI001ADC90C9|nr:hypothetical protein [Endozoicomonas sp. G2_1]MBO9490832.1 hypothetical protein [Endozoicomonas sp. G2_1]